jgi:uncharacterized protein YbaP (TraB family)
MRTMFRTILITLLFIHSAFAADQGLLWKIQSPQGATSYLLGTIHSDDPRVTEFSPSITEAFKSSEIFMLEALPPRTPSVYLLKQGDIAQMLTEAEFDRVRELAEFHVMHIEAAMRMKPWLLAVIFDLPKPKAMYSMDESLLADAGQQGKVVLGLENTQKHFSVLDNLSMDDQLTMLRAVLKRTQEQKQKDFEKLMSVYQSGQLDKIAAMDDEITGGMLPKELWQQMRQKLITERNQTMTESLVAQSQQHSVFAAVGASHLGGEDGILNRLRQAGYQINHIN